MKALEIVLLVMSFISLWTLAYSFVYFRRRWDKDQFSTFRNGTIMCGLPVVSLLLYFFFGVWAAVVSVLLVIVVAVLLTEAARNIVNNGEYGLTRIEGTKPVFLLTTTTLSLAWCSLALFLAKMGGVYPAIGLFLVFAILFYCIFNWIYYSKNMKKLKNRPSMGIVL